MITLVKPLISNGVTWLEAARDASVLANETTAIVPVYVGSGGGQNTRYFMTQGSSTNKVIDGFTVATKPLKPGVELDLIGISQHPGLIGQADHTDAVDAHVSLAAIYVEVNDGGGTPIIETFKFVTKQLPRSEFNKTPEGNYREIGLQFATDSLVLTEDTVTIANAAGTVLDAALAVGDRVRLTLEMSGRLNTETGRTNIYASGVSATVYDSTGAVLPSNAAAGYTYTVVGYDLDARRSNANRRSQGLLTSPTEEEERYVVPLGSPITSTSPVGTNRDASDLQTLVNVAVFVTATTLSLLC